MGHILILKQRWDFAEGDTRPCKTAVTKIKGTRKGKSIFNMWDLLVSQTPC